MKGDAAISSSASPSLTAVQAERDDASRMRHLARCGELFAALLSELRIVQYGVTVHDQIDPAYVHILTGRALQRRHLQITREKNGGTRRQLE